MLEFFQWLGNTGWSVALIESLYMWSFLESAHVLFLGLFVGTVLMMDLRLLGVAFKGIPASHFTRHLLPWSRIGFALMVTTGIPLFYSNPAGYYQNFFFRMKMVALVLAGVNVWLFHSQIHKKVSEWDEDPRPPRAARVAAAVSIFTWIIVVVAGRFTAYNWFDCDLQPHSDFVNWAAGCVVEGE
jgi:hypothetical protein